MESAGKRRKFAEPQKPSTAAAGGSRAGQPTSAGTAPPVIEPLAGYPRVIFGSKEQRERFENICDFPVIPTRFLDVQSLDDMGIRGPVIALLNGTGTSGLATMLHHTYETLTYEFFSSFCFEPSDLEENRPEARVSFRLLNKDLTLTLARFGSLLGINATGSTTPPRLEAFRTLWGTLTGGPRNRHHINDIEHPVPRYWFRLLCGTIFGRPEPNKLNATEQHMLAGYLNVDSGEPFVLNVAQAVAEHFLTIHTHRAIHCGGVVSHLAARLIPSFPPSHLVPLNLGTGKAALSASRLLHTKALCKAQWLVTKPSVHWKLPDARFLPLPCPTLPPLVPMPAFDSTLDPRTSKPSVPSYRLSARWSAETIITTDELMGAGCKRTPTHAPSPTSTATPSIALTPSPPPSTTPEPIYPVNFVPPPPFVPPTVIDQGHRDTMLFDMCTRVARMERDQALCGFLVYDSFAREGRLPPPGWPHPSYFRFPEGGYSPAPATADAAATVSELPTTSAAVVSVEGPRGDDDDDPDATGAG